MTTPDDLVATLDPSGVVWLDGGGADWSIVAWDPREIATDVSGARSLARGAGDDEPFGGGIVGYVPYDGPAWLARVEGAACFRHADATWHLTGTASFRAEARRRLDSARSVAHPGAARARRTSTIAVEEYERRVRQILAWIGDGDCYQVNLSRSVLVEGAGEPLAAYRRLSTLSRAPFGAYLRPSADSAVLCASPEMLLGVDDRALYSVPIKGTRPRHGDPVADRALAGALRTSEKDVAELVMIVDLVRNDLGRVATVGSVRWEPRRVTAHANVHHASQVVRAELAAGLDTWDALAALFPAGSVTGAPKIRACQRIAELEDEPRGVYCGTIGYAGARRARWNVAIRTASWAPDSGGTIRYHVGGGVVADSDPGEEWRETVAKGTVMARAFEGAEGEAVRGRGVYEACRVEPYEP